ncbi:MAG: BspA family leucine-rich repeat surface protein [Thermoplasmata archaeon]
MIIAEDKEHLRFLIKDVTKRKLRFEDIDISNIDSLSSIFENFEFKYEYGSIENWNVSNVEYFYATFRNAKNLWFDFKNWDMTKAIDCDSMFENCKDFKGKGLEFWNLKNLRKANYMFEGCTNLDINVSNWNIKNLNELKHMFYNCYNFRGIGLEKWNITLISHNEAFDGTFANCFKLDFNISNWNIRSEFLFNKTFFNCHNFKGKGLDKKTFIIINNPKDELDRTLDKTFANCYDLRTLPYFKNSEESNSTLKLPKTFQNCYSYRIKKIRFEDFENIDIDSDENPIELNFTNILPFIYDSELFGSIDLDNHILPNIYPTKFYVFSHVVSRRKSLKENSGVIYGFGNVKKLNSIGNQIDEYNLELCHNLVKFCKIKIDEQYKNYYRLVNDNKTISINSPNCIVEKFNFNEKSFFSKKNIFLNKNFQNKYFCFK